MEFIWKTILTKIYLYRSIKGLKISIWLRFMSGIILMMRFSFNGFVHCEKNLRLFVFCFDHYKKKRMYVCEVYMYECM